MSLNILTVTGRIGRDAEYRSFPNGGGVLSFSLAINTGYGDKQKTMWLRANIFGKRAEGGLRNYLVKGQEVAVSGELSENEFTDKNTGETKKTLEINVNNIELIGSKNTSAQPAPNNTGHVYGTPQGGVDQINDDLPF
ncbi:MAG: single-stranded DNA-binding protein [Gammaproteobacteria bacterium]|nr:single-stranded DNA-binding protein [Gammaproteobacteria bacterium]